ncbi:Mitochondrial import inner membrane translocase subunit tim50 [Hondaea fermentalgiana]|uniref:Mitochondrial import inner membrane translocase subunit tim50 n=1 Tax=Hondaea fermentalgiana TaxID=2315210 RepID=A0A2R5GIS7_9STRA|nr:Mitochondrial import inner membrane translocase subunit tim50 [Hondaea fermentalgiana]|eukprot:GBG27774.1 Mitochondrial import inner membrane translocase subunit tim50 [Hondaea fermentalgiana]
MIRPGAHPTTIETGATRSYSHNASARAGAQDSSLPPVNGHRNVSTDAKSAAAGNAANGPNRRRRQPHGPGVATGINANGAEKPYTSARLNAVRNSTLSNRPAIPPQAPQDKGKLTVVLDVDETLIHSRLSAHQEQFRQAEERKEATVAVEEFTITLADGEIVRVNKRPGLDKFLAYASEHYELFAYTAGLEEYARPLLDWLDPKGTIFRGRLYRDSCLFMRGYYLKDLQKFERPLSRVLLVDNNAFCFLPQLSNGVPISSWYDDPNDTALSVLATFLERIRDEKDVRPFLRKSFNLETLLREHREQIVG